jgi:hypothetical protein
MRIAVELQATGYTLDGVVEEARKAWRKFSNNQEAELPAGTELDISQEITVNKDSVYNAKVLIRTKVEDGAN